MTSVITYPDWLQNGDVLCWTRGPVEKGDIYLNLVRLATVSEYGHITVVWKKDNLPYHLEATQPVISHLPIPKGEVYVIRMGLQVSDEQMSIYARDKLGCKYSFRDAIMGYVGLVPKEEDRWQCAELTLDFLRSRGLLIPNAYTPSKLVRAILQSTGNPLSHLSYLTEE